MLPTEPKKQTWPQNSFEIQRALLKIIIDQNGKIQTKLSFACLDLSIYESQVTRQSFKIGKTNSHV